MTRKVPQHEPLAYSVTEYIELVPFGRTFIYQEINAGRLKTSKIGNRRIVKAEDGRAWLDSLCGTSQAT